VATLDELRRNNYNVVAVITMPDKPAGRGQQVQQSAVKKYALEHNLKIQQPEKLKDETFLKELRELKADLQIVVAFRMLPEVVWNMPSKGTINLHASLLPQYRGAAPINWAVINGEKETGVTTFFLQQEIDTGKIIFQEKININENDTAGDVHDTLMKLGAGLIIRTVQAIEKNDYPQIEQTKIISDSEELKTAPKIFKENCIIDWSKTCEQVNNQIRGLSPYPGASSNFVSPDNKIYFVKILNSKIEISNHKLSIGTILSDSKSYIKVSVSNGFVYISALQLAGKKRMETTEFLRGFQIKEGWTLK
jgi:methionyl-tRNA formyltransferase